MEIISCGVKQAAMGSKGVNGVKKGKGLRRSAEGVEVHIVL